MVRLTKQWSTEEPPMTLREAIGQAVDRQNDLMMAKSLSIEVDLTDELASKSCSGSVQSALQYLVGLAAERSPRAGAIQVLACATGQGLEIEIADDGDESEYRRFKAFKTDDCRQVVDVPCRQPGMGVFGTACPQGGMAWTLVVNQRMSATRAA